MNVVVLGAGLGGLSAACHLRGAGHDVLVLEREDVPGGRAGRLLLGDYRFDTGPTVLTMPDLLEQSFHAVGAELADFLTLHPVDPMYRACFEDGSVLHVRHGRDAMTDEIRDVCGPAEAAQFGRFSDWLAELYQLEMPNFIDRNFDSPLDLAWPLAPALRLVRTGGFRKLAGVVGSYFRDERLQRIFSFQSMYAGLAPYEALAIYCVITYMDSVQGVFRAEGGMHAIPDALARAADKAGVVLRYGATADRILLEHGTSGRVLGVRLDSGEVVTADAVVCNPDLPVAYKTLLGGLPAPRVTRTGRYSPSCLVWHAGVRGELPADAAHHNIHFGGQWDDAFRAILDDGTRMPDPSILVTVPSRDDPSFAPDGSHALFVLEPTPNLDGQVDWTREAPRARDQLAAKVAALGYPADIQVEHLVDPLDWERQGMERGTPFALAHTFFQTGPFRPNNIDRHAPGLVFVGSGTVPGVGIPMVLVGGRLAAERVDQLRPAGPARMSADPIGPGPSALPATDTPAPSRGRIVRLPDPFPNAADPHGPEGLPPTLEQSYAECKRLNKLHGTTYYWSTYALPRVKRHHVHALYGFCRYADEIVDDPAFGTDAEREAALTAFRDRFVADLDAGESTDLVLKAVIHTVRAFRIDPDLFHRFLRSMAMDLTVTTYETYADLQVYMDGSASVIGEMMLPILEPRSDAALAPARALGEAFQLTNFLRDVDEDLDRGRVYLPQEDLRRFGADPWTRTADEAWRELMRFEIRRARALYDQADFGVDLLPPSSARCIRAARVLYARILDVIEDHDLDVFTERARVPAWQKAVVVARALRTPPR